MRPTVWWEDGRVMMIDQRLLPTEERYHEYRTAAEVADAIKTMVIRGAPAIGVAAAMGVVLGVREAAKKGAVTSAEFDQIASLLGSTRPTAVNLFWAIERMRRRFRETTPAEL